jgi:hypothetical protein
VNDRAALAVRWRDPRYRSIPPVQRREDRDAIDCVVSLANRLRTTLPSEVRSILRRERAASANFGVALIGRGLPRLAENRSFTVDLSVRRYRRAAFFGMLTRTPLAKTCRKSTRASISLYDAPASRVFRDAYSDATRQDLLKIALWSSDFARGGPRAAARCPSSTVSTRAQSSLGSVPRSSME